MSAKHDRNPIGEGGKARPLATDETGLPPMPPPGAGPDEWREYHKTLFEAGKLSAPGKPQTSTEGGG